MARRRRGTDAKSRQSASTVNGPAKPLFPLGKGTTAPTECRCYPNGAGLDAPFSGYVYQDTEWWVGLAPPDAGHAGTEFCVGCLNADSA